MEQFTAQIYNLVGVPVILTDGTEIPAQGAIATVTAEFNPVPHPLGKQYPIYAMRRHAAQVRVNGLPFPAPQVGVFYLVSAEVAQALEGRTDVLIAVLGPDSLPLLVAPHLPSTRTGFNEVEVQRAPRGPHGPLTFSRSASDPNGGGLELQRADDTLWIETRP